MTDRLTLVGSWLGAEASFIWPGMLIQIIEDHVVGDIPAGGGEIASLPEALSPVAFADNPTYAQAINRLSVDRLRMIDVLLGATV